jgi:hypothetical protein
MSDNYEDNDNRNGSPLDEEKQFELSCVQRSSANTSGSAR